MLVGANLTGVSTFAWQAATRSLLIVAVSSLLGCSPGSGDDRSDADEQGAPGSAPGSQPAVGTGPLAETVMFFLKRDIVDPGVAGWRDLGEEAARVLDSIYRDVAQPSRVRQNALAALRNFDEPWVTEVLVTALEDRDKPAAVRDTAARSLLQHMRSRELVEGAVSAISARLLDDGEDVDVRRRMAAVLGRVEGAASRDALAAALAQQTDDVLHDAISRAARSQQLEDRRAELAASIEVHAAATVARFVPASPDELKVGEYGPDYIGRWRDSSIVVSLLSSLSETTRVRVEFDPLKLGLLFTDRLVPGQQAASVSMDLLPGKRVSIARRVEVKGIAIPSEVWIHVIELDRPVHCIPVTIQPEPAPSRGG